MVQQVYFPQDLVGCINPDHRLLGYKYHDVYIAIRFVSEDILTDLIHQPSLKDLCIIGGPGGDFTIKKHSNNLIPIITNGSDSFTVILFNPPNYKNLEYFSINPVLLQSMGEDVNSKYHFMRSVDYESTISNDEVLDKINSVLKLRLKIETQMIEMGILPKRLNLRYSIGSKFWNFLFKVFTRVILFIQLITIMIINIINYQFLGWSLVRISQIFRQLDLRLKQVTFFPIQFLCYYDKSILYTDNETLLKGLGLPLSNSNLNINNSNYINLYNSLWLITNDILIGVAMSKVFLKNQQLIRYWVGWCFKRFLIDELYQIISWISYHHPAGFKLNNELGKFMGDLFLWSLNMWESTVSKIDNDENIIMAINILCHMGLSFMIAMIIDCMNFLTLHVKWFYQISARIYQKQIEIIKSLLQLFRGKKYNVLRKRVDNLNNYSKPNEFDIDHLLLGTIIFMILILLLPTVFAIYLTFFVIRFSFLLLQNFFENLLIIINFLPMFVILLKLKNSNRLQGGVNFERLDYNVNKLNYLKLSNKSLTYKEIFKNFTSLFKKLKNFRKSLINSLFVGDLIGLNHNFNLKFDFLMLPQNYSKSIEIWKYFTNK